MESTHGGCHNVTQCSSSPLEEATAEYYLMSAITVTLHCQPYCFLNQLGNKILGMSVTIFPELRRQDPL